MGIRELTAGELVAAFRRGEVGAAETVDAYARGIEAGDGPLNAVVVRPFAEARAAAAALDRRRAAGEELGPLAGLPVTIKEAIAVAGLPWTNGSRLLAGRVADADAAAVRRLVRAGAIVIGKTNIPEFCAWFDTDCLIYGRTANPHALERSPGGSSGGEAAAIAAGLSVVGLGSDLGSSIRQPAAWTGIYGLKPSRGLVPNDGHAWFGGAFAFDRFAVIGPLARSVDDLALLMPVLADHPLAPPATGPAAVAVFDDDGLQPVAASCQDAVRRAAEALSAAGHAVEESVPPGLAELRGAYDFALVTELRHFAYPQVADRLDELSDYGRRAFHGLGGFPLDLGRYVGAGLRLWELESAVDAWQERYPIALCPVVPIPAPVAAEGLVAADGVPFRPGGKMTLATWVNTLGLPGLSVPCGRTADGLPLAVQVVGRRGCDAEVLAVGRELEAALGGAVRPPARAP